MSDAAILELERRIKEGDELAWPELDAELARMNRAPRRVWYLVFEWGLGRDRSSEVLHPMHATPGAALRHAEEFAAKNAVHPLVNGEPNVALRRFSETLADAVEGREPASDADRADRAIWSGPYDSALWIGWAPLES